MGEVYVAHDAVLDRQVAIKVLHRQLAGDSGFVERFRREARAAAGLSHQNIVAVHDWGAVDGIYYMVMEFVRGQSAREVLNTEGLLAPAQAADVLTQTLSALGHAHGKGIVHRDVKPENVMITRDGVVKVADFGLARAYADAQITEAGTVTGTVPYLAPEQLQGEPADPRTDLYSVGVVAYELLTGRLPFTGETPMAIAYKHIHERMPAPSSRNPAVPPGLDGWVASMTEKQRELRPESALEARRDLEREVSSLPEAAEIGTLVPDVAVHPIPAGPGRATTVTIPRTAKRRHRRRRGLRWAFGVLLALLAITAGAWGAWTYVIPHRADVPNVVGMSVRDASARLTEDGFAVREAEGEYSREIPAGSVIAVRPDVGTTLDEGTRVVIVPSLGPRPVDVPDVLGRTLAQARESLREAGLRLGEVDRVFSDEFPEIGRVIEQRPPAGEAPIGSAVDLVLSKGPSPLPVPRVTGMTEVEARATLDGLGFVVAADTAYSDDVPRGEVISQDPPKRTELQPGETVSIVVSLGPEEFALPSFKGMTREAALAQIRSLGLIPQVLVVPGGAGTTVVSQLPRAGTIVRAGDTIQIYVL
jgi:serine/threonine-protein kinase